MTPKQVLMCFPDYYGVEYEINPWMNVSHQPDIELARAQWKMLEKELKKAGLSVVLTKQISGFPDMVFAANAGLVHKQSVIISNFKHKERRGEKKHFKAHLRSLGYNIVPVPNQYSFEGEGDALVCNDKLVCGYGIRSDKLGLQFVADFLQKPPIMLKLIAPYFYHLDTCFSYLKKDLVLCYLPAFDQVSQTEIEKIGEVISVSRHDAENFVCNAVPVGNKLITGPMSAELKTNLEKHNIEPVEIYMSEFIKSGGAAKCLTLFI